MPCPHFSNLNGECVLDRPESEVDDDSRDTPVEDPVERTLCLSSDGRYRDCPVYQRFLTDLTP